MVILSVFSCLLVSETCGVWTTRSNYFVRGETLRRMLIGGTGVETLTPTDRY
jgi:hypothetical protein